MEQFIFSDENVYDGNEGKKIVTIDSDENFHMLRVLRIKVGDKILATNGQGKSFLCRLREAGREASTCEVLEEYSDLNLSRRKYCIGISMLKPVSKLELAIEKCTELGAGQFLLFYSERSEKTSPRMERLRGIIKSAVKQSLQSRFPDILLVNNLENVVTDGTGYFHKIVLHEKSDIKLDQLMEKSDSDNSAVVLVGPEGGFTDTEMEFLIGKEYRDCSLGSARLRSETAAMKAASLLSVY